MSDSAPPTGWVADTEPNERFTIYTRGNVGEVFPHVMTALTGTLIGDQVRQGQLAELVDMGATTARTAWSITEHRRVLRVPLHERQHHATVRSAAAWTFARSICK
jgi:hypothetical protein